MENKFDIPEDLQNLSKEELISIIKKLSNKRIKKGDSIKKKEKAPFDFKRYRKRHVALKFLYLGWDYCGFAVQTHTDKTIEAQLFSALEKTKLLESRETANYHRCGRTDKGVSAFSQVISLDLRSNLSEGKGIVHSDDFPESSNNSSEKEIDYSAILNRVLPPEIKVIAWAPVETSFSARFDCKKRTYKYWFPLGNLNVKPMQDAGQRLIGEHDFRNICKMDVGNGVLNYKRRIFRVDFKRLSFNEDASYDLVELTVIGQAFLWHQIRCIVSLLFLIGQGKEECEVIDKLLDIEKFPRKPQYDMASEVPLVLFDCTYEDVDWIYDEASLKFVIKQLQNLWTHYAVKTVIIRRMLGELENICSAEQPILNQAECLLPGVKPRVYKRLLDRQFCESLEEKIEHLNKKQKTNPKT